MVLEGMCVGEDEGPVLVVGLVKMHWIVTLLGVRECLCLNAQSTMGRKSPYISWISAFALPLCLNRES